MLASEVMDQSAAYLNDTQKNLYTYSAQLPYLQMANEDLEKLLIVFGSEVVRVKSAIISILQGTIAVVVNAGVGQTNLPADFLLPVSIAERAYGTQNPWVPVTEQTWEDDSLTKTSEIRFYAFRNNGIYFPSVGCNTDREIMLRYERQLQVISSQNTPEDFVLAKNFLSSKTAEMCARLVGMNSAFADEIQGRYVDKAEDAITRILTLNQQGLPQRRMRFGTKRIINLG
jgi:hypothetical protein